MGTFTGIKMSQYWDDLFVWEKFFNEYQVNTLIELGTDNGGLSIFFAAQCIQRGIVFHTFDHQPWVDYKQPLTALLGIEKSFHLIDLFSDKGKELVYTTIQESPSPVALFFDDGDKPREWKTFAPMTKAGDYCIVHDWEDEITNGDIVDVDVVQILADPKVQTPRQKFKTAWFWRPK